MSTEVWKATTLGPPASSAGGCVLRGWGRDSGGGSTVITGATPRAAAAGSPGRVNAPAAASAVVSVGLIDRVAVAVTVVEAICWLCWLWFSVFWLMACSIERACSWLVFTVAVTVAAVDSLTALTMLSNLGPAAVDLCAGADVADEEATGAEAVAVAADVTVTAAAVVGADDATVGSVLALVDALVLEASASENPAQVGLLSGLVEH